MLIENSYCRPTYLGCFLSHVIIIIIIKDLREGEEGNICYSVNWIIPKIHLNYFRPVPLLSPTTQQLATFCINKYRKHLEVMSRKLMFLRSHGESFYIMVGFFSSFHFMGSRFSFSYLHIWIISIFECFTVLCSCFNLYLDKAQILYFYFLLIFYFGGSGGITYISPI